MPINTLITLNKASTAVYLKAQLPESYKVTETDSRLLKQKKLEQQDELYSRWRQSAQDRTKSPCCPSSPLNAHHNGYGGSLYFINEDRDEPEIMLIHLFEDFYEQELNPSTGQVIEKGKKSGAYLARAYRSSQEFQQFQGLLVEKGFDAVIVEQFRYKAGDG